MDKVGAFKKIMKGEKNMSTAIRARFSIRCFEIIFDF